MDLDTRLTLSYYKEIANINENHDVYLVQHQHTKKIFVKKILRIYDKNIFIYIKEHPIANLPKIYEVFEDGNKLIVIEEYISGNTLEDMLNEGHAFSDNEIKEIIIKLCHIVNNLHSAEPAIIHRDIKPSNIIITPSDELVLLDLNAAKNLSIDKNEDTRLLGTRGYAAPEQYGFGASNLQTDIYAIGVLINTLVSGKYSLELNDNSSFYPIINKCTQMNPSDRYTNINEILLAVGNPAVIVSKKPDWKEYLPPGFRQRNPMNMLIATVIYTFILWISFGLTVKDTPDWVLFYERIITAIIFIGAALIAGNYRDVHKFLPFHDSANKLLKYASLIISIIIYIFLGIFLMVVWIAFISKGIH